MSAQTLQNSAGFFSDKHSDILRFYPMIEQEFDGKPRIGDNMVEIYFKNGSKVTNITNGANAKGRRRNGIVFEEAALLDLKYFTDNTSSITSEEIASPRYQSTYDPYCKNKQVFVTTAYYKNEMFEYCRKMVLRKIECQNAFVYGASYRLPSKFGRGQFAKGSTDMELIEQRAEMEKEKVGTRDFNFNYASRWLVSNGSCIVDIDLLKSLQTLSKPEMKPVKDGEYYIGIDVARSAKTSNNASALAVVKTIRDSKNKVRELQAVNLVKLPNGMNFKEQAMIAKKLTKLYNAQALVVDINGLGKGLMDYLLDENIFDDGEVLEPFDMINTDYRSSYSNAKRIIYGIEAQSNNTDMITQFINIVETKKLRLLEHFDVNKAFDIPTEDYLVSEVLPYLRTENFVSEVENLTVEQIPGTNKLKVGQLVRADKDIFSATQMVCWYIMKYCNDSYEEEEEDVISVLRTMVRKPRIR